MDAGTGSGIAGSSIGPSEQNLWTYVPHAEPSDRVNGRVDSEFGGLAGLVFTFFRVSGDR